MRAYFIEEKKHIFLTGFAGIVETWFEARTEF